MTLGTILNQIIPTYGNWGGPGWSAGERTPDGKDPDWNYATVDALDELFKAHDKAYWDAEHNASDSTEAAKMVYQADVDLLRGMQNLGVYKDTGLYSILYAPLATDLFGMKSLYDISNIMLTTLGKFDTSLDRFLFLEGADLSEDDWKNIFDAYNTNNPDGHQTDYNPFTPQMQDPLVIDADKDGFISTVSLAESEVYFDITGNGVKTKTSWVKGNDAILVYDENEDGKIDNINEAFGNATTSGFDELRNTIDSNYDNKIDRKDILFNRLQLWHDYDQDGSVDEGELKSLKEEGITSIDLNSVQTNINLEGAVLTEASHYTDTSGNKELAADIHLAYDAKNTIIREKIIYQNVA